MMKHAKMSRRTKEVDPRGEVERLEQQRIDFEHRARLARQNLYGLQPSDPRGWVDHKIQ